MLKSLTKYQELKDFKINTFLESYQVLEKIITNDFTISRNEILKIIDYDDSLNKRALDKIIERQNERFKRFFGFENGEYFYNRKLKKYQLMFEHVDDLLPFKILYDYLLTLIYSDKIDKDKTNLSKVLMFNDDSALIHIPMVIRISNAIHNKKVIEFKHFNHFRGTWATHKVEPWFIKQYRGSFFLGCYRIEKEGDKTDVGYKTFTINQIESNSLVILDSDINVNRKNNQLESIKEQIFEHCIGVRVHSEKNPNELCTYADIIIETNYKVGKDWKNRKIHKKQKFVEEISNGNHIFRFPKFYFNDAFKQIILSYGSAVKVIEPKEVINEIKEELMLTLKNNANKILY